MSDRSLAAALDALAAVALAAGADPDSARREGECLAATVAEPARGAFVDWTEQTGVAGGGGAEAFMDAASRGRRYRSAPTPTMAALALARSAQAPAYAAALGDVALAACTLGEPSPRVVGNATTAAAAQLGEAAAPPVLGSVAREPVPGVGDHLLARVLDQLDRVQRTLTDGDPADETGPGGFVARKLAPQPPNDPVVEVRGAQGEPPVVEVRGAQGEPPVVEVRGAPATSHETTPPEPDPEAEPEPDPKTVEELLAELDGLIGLSEVKAEIHRQAALLRVEGLRAEAGLAAATITRHMIFNGNPGTGKTTVARLVAGIYRALGLLSQGQLVEVDRSELVAGYLGQTAMKTAEVVASAAGGVLFIDEAYSLAGDQYGQEAVDTLVKEMEDRRDDLVVIVAGYPLPMEVFVAQNPGLASRFRTTIDFADYTDDELAAIFAVMLESAEYDAGPDVVDRLRALLLLAERGPRFGNARWVRNVLEAAIGRHAWRLREVEQPSLEQLRTLEPDDLDPVALVAPPVAPLVAPPVAPAPGGGDDAGAPAASEEIP